MKEFTNMEEDSEHWTNWTDYTKLSFLDEIYLRLPCRFFHKKYFYEQDRREKDNVVLIECGFCGKLHIFDTKGNYRHKN